MDGRSLRSAVPRSSHAAWDGSSARDPLGILRSIFATLMPDLVPLRIARMSASPFSFYRGSAAIMAADLATLPRTGIETQISGDAHVANFGGYASPERRLVFDINDFDETVSGPWEWDLKRLAASLVLAGRDCGLRSRVLETVVRPAVVTYRDRIAAYAAMSALDVWYAAIDISGAVATALDARARQSWLRAERDARRQTALSVMPRITQVVGGNRRFVEDPPGLEHHGSIGDPVAYANRVLEAYRKTIRHDAQILLDRFTAVDCARKVVGVGSVGTWCALMLLIDGEGNPLLLQIKEARASALEPYVGAQSQEATGERVVSGQRVMQAASDALLGWADVDGRCVYVRQYRDMKASPDLTALRADELQDYGMHCAWALARAHARAGDAKAIAAYVGRGNPFVDAITSFAFAYADQATRDHAAFVAATPELVTAATATADTART